MVATAQLPAYVACRRGGRVGRGSPVRPEVIMSRLGGHRLRAAMVFAVFALFVSLAGTGYAAMKLSANSVSTKRIKSDSLLLSEVTNRSLGARDFGARLV